MFDMAVFADIFLILTSSTNLTIFQNQPIKESLGNAGLSDLGPAKPD